MADPIDFLTGRSMRWGYDADTAPKGIRNLYQALAPRPGTTYGDILPIAVDPDRSWRIAMPNVVRDSLLGVADLLSGTETGEVTARGAMSLGLGGLGVGASTAPRGALAVGGANPPGFTHLAMDSASRDARARAMGFLSRPGTDEFLTLYHGTNKDISPGFLASPPYRATNAASAEAGIWASESPSVAHMYAEHAAQAGGGGANVLPLRVRADKVGTLRPTPDLTELQVLGALKDAWDAGYDAIRVPFPSTPEGVPAITNWVIKEPNQLRSPFAVFDPARIDSSDLMAGVAVPGPVVGGSTVPSVDPAGIASMPPTDALPPTAPSAAVDPAKLDGSNVVAADASGRPIAVGPTVFPPPPSPAAAWSPLSDARGLTGWSPSMPGPFHTPDLPNELRRLQDRVY